MALRPNALENRRGDYGYDAHVRAGDVRILRGSERAARDIALAKGSASHGSAVSRFFAVFFFLNGVSFFYTTRRGKFLEWEQILDGLHLRGDERVLDMGCGRERCSRQSRAG